MVYAFTGSTMSLGLHLALSKQDVTRIEGFADPDELALFISGDLEERYIDDARWSCQTDKAWDAIHRCLGNGMLVYGEGPFPLAYAVLGGRALAAGEDCTACLVDAPKVPETSRALAMVTRAWFEERYRTLRDTDYAGPVTSQDCEHTWGYFEALRAFYAKAANAGRAVLFTTDG